MAKLAEAFGTEIRTRRKARGLTQAQLAEATGLSEEWIRRMERGAGAPSFDALEGLAAALDTSVAALFSAMPDRESRLTRLFAVAADLSEAELTWLEKVVRAVVSRP